MRDGEDCIGVRVNEIRPGELVTGESRHIEFNRGESGQAEHKADIIRAADCDTMDQVWHGLKENK